MGKLKQTNKPTKLTFLYYSNVYISQSSIFIQTDLLRGLALIPQSRLEQKNEHLTRSDQQVQRV